MNSSKNIFFTVDKAISFNNNIHIILGYHRGTISFIYLGVPISSGAPKR